MRDRREKVADLVLAAAAGTLSSAAALLMESHCVACRECGGYFDALRRTGTPPAGDPPSGIRTHLIALMRTIPPGEEFFLA